MKKDMILQVNFRFMKLKYFSGIEEKLKQLDNSSRKVKPGGVAFQRIMKILCFKFNHKIFFLLLCISIHVFVQKVSV